MSSNHNFEVYSPAFYIFWYKNWMYINALFVLNVNNAVTSHGKNH